MTDVPYNDRIGGLEIMIAKEVSPTKKKELEKELAKEREKMKK